jgi:hypothetical protein
VGPEIRPGSTLPITDELKSYAAAKRKIMSGIEHRQHKGLNNRGENTHQPTRRRERIMKRSKSPRQVQRFLSIHDQIVDIFSRRPDQDTAANFRSVRNQAFTIWAKVPGAAMAAYSTGVAWPRACRHPTEDNLTVRSNHPSRYPVDTS